MSVAVGSREVSCFLTHLTLPARAEIRIGDDRAQAGAPKNPTPVTAAW